MATLTKWVLDPMHSEVQFKVKHLVISTVSGFFKSFEGELDTENDDFSDASISFSLDIDSIDTNQTQRDEGITNPVTLDVEFGGAAADFYGNTKAGFEISGKINRKDFGLTWSGVTEAGSVVVGEDIKLLINVQFAKQA